MNTTGKLANVRAEFIERIGLFSQGDGLPRIAGRILGMLVFDGRAYSFSQLADELQVSRGSISSNVRILEERGVIERVSKPGDRQDYFRLADDPFATVLSAAVIRTQKAVAAIRKSIDQLPSGNADVKRRLDDYRAFYQNIGDAMAQMAEPKSRVRNRT